MMERLIKDIKSKKELKGLPDKFVKQILDSYLSEHELDSDNPKSKEYRHVVKEVRKVLREVYGAFREDKLHKREKLLLGLDGLDDISGHEKILALHRSTRERLPFYSEVYGKIFSITGKPSVILDLGCGMNPVSYPFMKLDKVKYYASELSKDDTDFIQTYFDKMGIDGEAFAMDLTDIDSLPECDVCFMFKLLDTLETLKSNISKELVEGVKAKWLVVSFPTKTLGGRKRISVGRLGWFEKIISGMEFQTFEIENEIFYVVQTNL